MTPHAECAIAIFAKYPRPGRVKTRLSKAPVPGFRQLGLDECAALYDAFLRDYIHRLNPATLPQFWACFCLRPGPDTEAFDKEYGQGAIATFEEPRHRGQAAEDIGQAMGFAIRGLLEKGFLKVLILGSDLPHIPLDALRRARELLDEHPLVLGDDGGGCYLVGARQPSEVLESRAIAWSENRDYEALQMAQKEAGLTVGLLPESLEDIDTPAALAALIARLREAPDSLDLPHTAALLRRWGALDV